MLTSPKDVLTNFPIRKSRKQKEAFRTDVMSYAESLGYPCSVELSDGSIMTVYYQKWPGEWRTSVLYSKWRLEEK
jgi:hypothetical protein